MKNIFRTLFLTVLTAATFVSCDYDETSYESLVGKVDPNATYYIQFANANKGLLQSSVDEMGEIVDIETTIDVVLLGLPQSEAITVDLAIDPSSTLTSSMYTLGTTSITIPAGKTSGSTTLVTNTEMMPEGETLKLVVNIDAGENSATSGTQLTYELQRIKYCALTLDDFVGTWSGTDSWGYASEVTTFVQNGKLYMNGIGFGWFQDWWGEVIVTNQAVEVDVDLVGGIITIDRSKQSVPYITSTWNGAPQPSYNILGSGKVTDRCDLAIEFDYSFDQEGSVFNGTSWGPAFKEVISLN